MVSWISSREQYEKPQWLQGIYKIGNRSSLLKFVLNSVLFYFVGCENALNLLSNTLKNQAPVFIAWLASRGLGAQRQHGQSLIVFKYMFGVYDFDPTV